jgi:hypothetical protein
LFFGWAYILCATLLERQGIKLQYSELVVDNSSQNQGQSLEIDIGNVSAEEWRWWNALVAPGQGWLPVSKVLPPWFIAYRGNMRFRVVGDILDDISPSTCDPPSSKQAVEYLARFASAYNISSQSSLALAIALSLPLHNKTKSTIQLPTISSFTRASRTSASTPTSVPKMQQDFDNILCYMSLSSNPQYFSSALWSVFWEPEIDCNLVSAWYEPIVQVISPFIKSGNCEILAHILAYRCPRIAPLWYGVLACGQTTIFHRIINFLITSRTPTLCRPMEEVAAWTGSPQSFMGVYGSGPYLRGEQVSRADVWRLRHEFSGDNDNPDGLPFKNLPFSPWKPFGSIASIETDLAVRTHLEYDRHQWSYANWVWLLNGKQQVDQGFGEETPVIHDTIKWDTECGGEPPPVIGRNFASRQAISDTFRWAASQMEVSGNRIYSHPWVLLHPSIDHELEDLPKKGDSAERGQDQQRMEEWLQALPDFDDCLSEYNTFG